MTKEEADKESCRVAEAPHGWIQWKGTEVCIDLHCVCGHHGHVDGDFLYYYKCHECGRVFALDPVIRLMEISEEPDGCISSCTDCGVTDK
jgi:DNA-directed RNA polymerase subunit RPC12/RpoP